MFQLRLAWEGYWKVATAPALDAMLSRQAATESAVRFQTLFEDAPAEFILHFATAGLKWRTGRWRRCWDSSSRRK